MNKRKEHFKKIRLVSIIVMGMIISIPLTTTHAQLQIPGNVHISPIQLSQLTYNLKSNLAQRNLSNKELNLYQQLYSIANDSSQLYDPAIQHPSEQYENIRKKIHQQFDTVKQLAIQTYGSNANQKILLATNAFILMYYDALSRDNPKFFWPNLGVFVANDVRSNYALTFSLSNALDPLKISNDQEIIIAGKNIPTLQSIISHANQLLIEGQANVMADIVKTIKTPYNIVMSYSEHFRKKVLAKLKEGYSIRTVAAQFEIDKNTIVQWKKRIEIKRTRPRQPSKIDHDRLRADVEQYPDDYQYERARRFNCSASAMGSALRRLKITVKKRPYSIQRQMHNKDINF